MTPVPPDTSPGRRALLLIVGSMGAVYFFSYFQRVAVPGTIFNELQAEFHTSAGAVAWLAALYLYLYGSTQLVVGLLNDRFGAGRILVAGGALLSTGSILFPLAPSLPLLYVARVLVGLGASLIYVSIVKAIDQLFASRHFAQLLGVCLFLGYAGGLTGTLPFERVVAASGWRPALLGAGALCSLTVVGMFLLFRRTGMLRSPPQRPSPLVLLAILRNPLSWPILCTGAASFSVYFLVQATIGKKFLSDYCGLSSAAAASFTFLMMLVTMVTLLSGGFLSRLHGNRRRPFVVLACGICLLAVIGLLACLHWQATSGWFLACYILLALSSLSSPLSSALMKEWNPAGAVGTSIGLLNGACYLVVALVANLAGGILDRYQDRAVHTATAVIYPAAAYRAIFLLCAALALASLLAALMIRESHGRQNTEG